MNRGLAFAMIGNPVGAIGQPVFAVRVVVPAIGFVLLLLTLVCCLAASLRASSMSLALTMLPYEASNTFLAPFLGAAVSVWTPSYEVR
jgi:hypothetical protein